MADSDAIHYAVPNRTPTKLNRLIKWLREKPWRVFLAVFLACTWLTLLILLDYNRYKGYCAKREFHDSIGPPLHEGDRNSCRVERESARPIPPGRLPGQIFTSSERSLPSWILVGLFSFVTSVINFVLICNHPKKKQSENAERKTFSHHQSEHGRVSWIIYVCTTVILVYQAINMAKIADCRHENGAEIFYTVMLAIDVSMQGVFLLSEVVVGRHFGSKKSSLRTIALFFLGICNFIMWGHSIGDAVCRKEIDNAAIVGYQIWDFFDPIFGSAVVFFRILSGCLYISLTVPSDHPPEDHNAGKPYLISTSENVNNHIDENDKKNSIGVTEFMMSNRKVRKQTLTIFNEPGTSGTVTNFYYSAQNDRFHRNTIRSYYGSVVAILFVVVPFVAYDALARHVGKKHEGQLKYVVELTINILLIGLNGWFIIFQGGFPNAESAKRLLGCTRKGQHTRRYSAIPAECEVSDCSISQKCSGCKCCELHCKGVQRFLHMAKHVVEHTNIEIPVFFVFSLFAVCFYIASAVVEHGGDRATDIIGIFSVILQSTFVFWTALVHNSLNLLRHGNYHHSWNSFLLSLLFAVTVGSLAVDIEREHVDHEVHNKWYLRVFAPLLVDFRVHAAILTYSVLSEFDQQRLTERDIEDKKIFERVDNEPSLAEGSECHRLGCKTLYSRESDDAFWKCTAAGNGCQSKPYCNDCFKEFIVKVGFCPTCGDQITCKPTMSSNDNNINNDSTHADSGQGNNQQQDGTTITDN